MSSRSVDERVCAFFEARCKFCTARLVDYLLDIAERQLKAREERHVLSERRRLHARPSAPQPADGFEYHQEAGWSGWIQIDLLRETEKREAAIREPNFPPSHLSRRLSVEEKLIILALRVDRQRGFPTPLRPVENRLVELERDAQREATFSEWALGRIPRRKIVAQASTLICLERCDHVRPDGRLEKRPVVGDKKAAAWLDELERLVPVEAPTSVAEAVANAPPAERQPAAQERERAQMRKRGRRPDTDPGADARIADAWATKAYRTHADLAAALGREVAEVKAALDRHRKRQGRAPE